MANAIVYTKGVWKWGWENRLLATPMRYGSGFARPSAKTMRATRNEHGPRMFEPKQILAILQVASANVKALTLLGINAALGNTDLALLPMALGWGAGGEANAPLARAIVGAVLGGALLTLFVVPALYGIFGRFVRVQPELAEPLQ